MTLSQRERRWAEVVGRTLIPKGVCGATLDSVSASDRFAHEVATCAWYVAVLLRVSLLVAWLSPFLLRGKLHTLGGIVEGERSPFLEALLCHRNYTLRSLSNVLKITFCTALIGEPRLLLRLNAYGLAEEAEGASLKQAAGARR